MAWRNYEPLCMHTHVLGTMIFLKCVLLHTILVNACGMVLYARECLYHGMIRPCYKMYHAVLLVSF